MAAGSEDRRMWDLLLLNPSYSWHSVIAPLYAACGLGILAFLWAAFRRLRVARFLILGFGCWAAAAGLDFIEGLESADRFYDWVQDSLAAGQRRYLVTHTFKVFEEVLEMLGTTLLWVGFLNYLAHVLKGHRLKFDLAE
jgi:hypothetical protein